MRCYKLEKWLSRKERFQIYQFNGKLISYFVHITNCILSKISINVLCCYCQFLSRSFKSVCSIKNYLNGVRILFLLQGMEINKFSSFELKLTLRGLSRVLQHLPKQALPITLEILEKIHKYLNFKKIGRCDILVFIFICIFSFI